MAIISGANILYGALIGLGHLPHHGVPSAINDLEALLELILDA